MIRKPKPSVFVIALIHFLIYLINISHHHHHSNKSLPFCVCYHLPGIIDSATAAADRHSDADSATKANISTSDCTGSGSDMAGMQPSLPPNTTTKTMTNKIACLTGLVSFMKNILMELKMLKLSSSLSQNPHGAQPADSGTVTSTATAAPSFNNSSFWQDIFTTGTGTATGNGTGTGTGSTKPTSTTRPDIYHGYDMDKLKEMISSALAAGQWKIGIKPLPVPGTVTVPNPSSVSLPVDASDKNNPANIDKSGDSLKTVTITITNVITFDFVVSVNSDDANEVLSCLLDLISVFVHKST